MRVYLFALLDTSTYHPAVPKGIGSLRFPMFILLCNSAMTGVDIQRVWWTHVNPCTTRCSRLRDVLCAWKHLPAPERVVLAVLAELAKRWTAGARGMPPGDHTMDHIYAAVDHMLALSVMISTATT